MFRLVPVVCLHDPDFVEAKGKLCSRKALGGCHHDCLKKEVCKKGAWLCGCGFQWFVSVFVIVQSWSDNVSIEKTVLPGVWSLLDGGGYGSAKITYPCLVCSLCSAN